LAGRGLRRGLVLCIICVGFDNATPPVLKGGFSIAAPPLDEFADLDPFLPQFGQLVLESLRFFVEEYAHVRHVQELRTNANAVRDVMKRKAEELAVSDPHNFRTTQINNLFLLIVRDKYGIRLKQLDDYLRPKNNETAQSVAFQTQQMVVPDLGAELISLNLGYVADWTELLNSRIVMVCPDGLRSVRVWEFGESKVIPLPIEEQTPELPAVEPRPQVRAKEDGAEHSEPQDS
jgi:hypothetical protein